MLIQELVKDKNDIYAVVPKTDEKRIGRRESNRENELRINKSSNGT